jgi:hypothetical protein
VASRGLLWRRGLWTDRHWEEALRLHGCRTTLPGRIVSVGGGLDGNTGNTASISTTAPTSAFSASPAARQASVEMPPRPDTGTPQIARRLHQRLPHRPRQRAAPSGCEFVVAHKRTHAFSASVSVAR